MQCTEWMRCGSPCSRRSSWRTSSRRIHPLRPIRLPVNGALKRLNGLFSVMYSDTGGTKAKAGYGQGRHEATSSWYSGGQGVHREVEPEGHEEKYRAVIEGPPHDEPVGQRWGKVEPALSCTGSGTGCVPGATFYLQSKASRPKKSGRCAC